MSDYFMPLTNMYDKPLMIMLVGLPGSGKSTTSYQLSKINNATVFSSDEYRGKLFGSPSIQGDPVSLFDTLHTDIFEALKEGKNVIYDATNLVAKRRMSFLNEIKKRKIPCAKIAYVLLSYRRLYIQRL